MRSIIFTSICLGFSFLVISPWAAADAGFVKNFNYQTCAKDVCFNIVAPLGNLAADGSFVARSNDAGQVHLTVLIKGQIKSNFTGNEIVAIANSGFYTIESARSVVLVNAMNGTVESYQR